MIREYLHRCFGSLSRAELMQRELDQAHRSLLEAHSDREYAESMVAYHQARIARLSGALREAA
jgi:hypothetical protein